MSTVCIHIATRGLRTLFKQGLAKVAIPSIVLVDGNGTNKTCPYTDWLFTPLQGEHTNASP